MKVNHDTWMATAFLLFCAFAAWQIAHLPAGVGGHSTMGPAFFPAVMTATVALLSLALLVRSLKRGTAKSSVVLVHGSALRHVFAFLALLVAYACAYEKLGFILASAPALMLGMRILGEKRLTHILLWPCCLIGLAWVAFTQVMQVQLPTFNLW